jgi:SOS response regulatory protein OraA/RecX
MSTDGDRLAPVTWLFGTPEQTAPEAPAESPSAAPLVVSESVPPATREPAEREPATREPHIRESGSFDRINNVSMHALARRGMSAQEMADYLIGREFLRDEVELECERLLGVGLLDDHALAETLVRTLRERKGLGRQALVSELRRRKLDADAVAVALEELDGGDELERAIDLAVRRAPQLRSYDQETAKRRLGAFLMRKGYSGSVVSTAVARALQPSGGPAFR